MIIAVSFTLCQVVKENTGPVHVHFFPFVPIVSPTVSGRCTLHFVLSAELSRSENCTAQSENGHWAPACSTSFCGNTQCSWTHTRADIVRTINDRDAQHFVIPLKIGSALTQHLRSTGGLHHSTKLWQCKVKHSAHCPRGSPIQDEDIGTHPALRSATPEPRGHDHSRQCIKTVPTVRPWTLIPGRAQPVAQFSTGSTSTRPRT
ncbi:hypothetical protein BKA93DRAFT_495628 [Sparassis latifolia]